MRILYEKEADGILILRCFGHHGVIELPSAIDGLPVTAIAAYAFSDREDKDKEGFFYDDGKLVLTKESSLRELTGEAVEEILLPSSLKRVGRYAFYGCRSLKRFAFSDNFTDIGQGAFTGCRGLSLLEVDCLQDTASALGEVLGHISGEIRVRVRLREKGEEFMLFFPEIYEAAAENTPARIISTRYYGSGESYRQCFYDKRIDFKKYDSLFYMAKAGERGEIVAELAAYRLIYPRELSQKAKEEYLSYFREHARQVLAYAIEKEWQELFTVFSSYGLYTQENLSFCIDEVFKQEKNEWLSFFMEERKKAEGKEASPGGKRKRFLL